MKNSIRYYLMYGVAFLMAIAAGALTHTEGSTSLMVPTTLLSESIVFLAVFFLAIFTEETLRYADSLN